jgi:hypothetical protein
VDEDLRKIPGFDAVVEHFGRWPSFHDAVVEKLNLNLPGESVLEVRTWNTTGDLDERGYYRTTHYATVRILVTEVLELDLSGSDLEAGSILFGLSLLNDGVEYRLSLDPSLGLGGEIRCRGIRLEIFPKTTT